MRLPEIATRLRYLARELNCPELNRLAAEIKRRSPVSRAPASSVPASPELRDRIRAFKADNPHMSQAEIGARFGVNSGRVSEALAGFRK